MRVMKSTLFVSLLFLVVAGPAAAVTVSGVVFNDLNGNGELDPGEAGIAGVPVSNGEDIVLTDASGRYTIGLNDLGVVFVLKPRDWAVPVDPETRAQSAAYFHRPDGSPELRYGGIAPTGPLPESINFPLRHNPEADAYRVLCFGDTQPRNQQEVDYMSHHLIKEVAGIDVEFGFTLGDLVFDNLDILLPMARGTGMIGVPWHYVPGNHDIDFDAPTWEQTFETYRNVFGPDYYAFAHGPAHFVVLSCVRLHIGERSYDAELGERQRNFVKNYLALAPHDSLVVFLMHMPVMRLEDRDEFFDLLRNHTHTLSMSSHTHRHHHHFLGEESGWKGEQQHHHIVHGTACGSWYTGNFDATGIPLAFMSDGSPKGYSILNIDGNKYDLEFRATQRPADYQMDIFAPDAATVAEAAGEEVIVNFFTGSERCKVEMRIGDDADWIVMERYDGIAPFFQAAYDRQEQFLALVAQEHDIEEVDDAARRRIASLFQGAYGRLLPSPGETNHLWRANLPETLEAGWHFINVRATDLFGRTHSDRRIIRIE